MTKGGVLDLRARGPGDLLELGPDLAEEALQLSELARAPAHAAGHPGGRAAAAFRLLHLSRLCDRHAIKPRKARRLSRPVPPPAPRATTSAGGRPGGTRTPNPRFW